MISFAAITATHLAESQVGASRWRERVVTCVPYQRVGDGGFDGLPSCVADADIESGINQWLAFRMKC